MEKFCVEGLIVKVSVTGESDRIVRILTKERGVIGAFAKGARSVKGKLHSSTAQFAYGTFWLTESKGSFNINDVQIEEMFFDLRNDIKKLTLGQYFCEVALACCDSGAPEPEFLRLILNSLYFLNNGKKPAELIKIIFELRSSVIFGYLPELVACEICGEYETPVMYFDCAQGLLYCSSCGRAMHLTGLSAGAVGVMRHIVYSDFDKIFSFSCKGEDIPSLEGVAERYFHSCTQTEFRTLDFYRNIKR